MPPDFGCCACAIVGAATAMATAKQKSLVISLLPVLRDGSPTVPLLFLGPHANGCAVPEQPLAWPKPCGMVTALKNETGNAVNESGSIEIGRASCRERVEVSVVGGSLKKKKLVAT